jgi:glycosyltransferase involved in cell wall biosynthesis
MRIASVNQDPGIAPGRAKGAAVHLAALRAAFAERGAEVVAIDEPDPAAAAARLAAAAAAAPLDLVYERYALGRAAAARWAEARGVPYAVEVNAPLAVEERLFRAGGDGASARRADRALFGAATLVLAVSRAVADYAAQRGAPRARVEVVPNAVDPRLFAPERRAEWGGAGPVPPGRFAVGFHGRLRPWHGIELLAAACRDLLARGVDLHLVAVGAGDFAAAFDGVLPSERRTLAPWCPHAEVGRYVALFDALPLAYPPETPCYFSPLKLAEAMASGAVPVVPATGDLPERVGDGGLTYPPGDRAALVAALERLAREPERRARLARAALSRARAHTWRSVADLVCARLLLGAAR